MDQRWILAGHLEMEGLDHQRAFQTACFLSGLGIYHVSQLHRLSDATKVTLHNMDVLDYVIRARQKMTLAVFISQRMDESNPAFLNDIVEHIFAIVQERCTPANIDPQGLVFCCNSPRQFGFDQMIDNCASSEVFVLMSTANYLRSLSCLLEFLTAFISTQINGAKLLKVEHIGDVNYDQLNALIVDNGVDARRLVTALAGVDAYDRIMRDVPGIDDRLILGAIRWYVQTVAFTANFNLGNEERRHEFVQNTLIPQVRNRLIPFFLPRARPRFGSPPLAVTISVWFRFESNRAKDECGCYEKQLRIRDARLMEGMEGIAVATAHACSPTILVNVMKVTNGEALVRINATSNAFNGILQVIFAYATDISTTCDMKKYQGNMVLVDEDVV